MPFSGGAYLRVLPWWIQSFAWHRAVDLGHNVILYVHPWELDPHHPRIDLPSRLSIPHYAHLDATRRRLEALLATYRFGTVQDAFFSTNGNQAA
jgi:hypothetical protein